MNSDVRRPRPASSRRWVLSFALLIGALVVVLIAVGVLPGDGRTPGGAAAATAPTPSAPSTATPPPLSPSPTGPTSDATALPPVQEPVPLDAATQVGEVGVSLLGIDAIQGTASGPGDVAGPALRIRVRIDNGSPEPLDLLLASVRVTYGPDESPASPLGDPSVAMFSGMLEPGKSADGVYVFRVPVDARDAVTVSVSHSPGAPYAVFTGAV